MALRFDGSKLARLRRQQTQTDLANALRGKGYGTTQTTVSRWESGQEPRPYIIEALAEQLGCKVSELYTDDESEAALSESGDFSRDDYALFGVLAARFIRAKALNGRLERVLESEGSAIPTFVLVGVCCLLLATGWSC